MNSRNWPDAFLLIRLFSVYKMDNDLKKKWWMKRMRTWVPFSLYIFPADWVLEASDCFGWKSSSRSWQASTSFNGGGYSIIPILMSLKKQSLIPDFCLLLSIFFIGTQKESWKYCSACCWLLLRCSAVLVSSCVCVRSDVVVFTVAIPPKLDINSSKLQKADQSQTDRLVVKTLSSWKDTVSSRREHKC